MRRLWPHVKYLGEVNPTRHIFVGYHSPGDFYAADGAEYLHQKVAWEIDLQKKKKNLPEEVVEGKEDLDGMKAGSGASRAEAAAATAGTGKVPKYAAWDAWQATEEAAGILRDFSVV
jgi:hypothetical protein